MFKLCHLFVVFLLPTMPACCLPINVLENMEEELNSSWIQFLCDLQNQWSNCRHIVMISWYMTLSHKQLHECLRSPVTLIAPDITSNVTRRVPSINFEEEVALVLTDDVNLTLWLPTALARLPLHTDLRVTVALLFSGADDELLNSIAKALWYSEYINGVILYKYDESDEISVYRYYPYSKETCGMPGPAVLVAKSESAISLPEAVYADNLLHNLNGCVLRCGMFPPLANMSKINKGCTVVMPELNQLVVQTARQDMNFDCEYLDTRDGHSWGYCLPDGSRSGLLGDLCDHYIEIALFDFQHTLDRWLVSDLVHQYREDCLTGVVLVGMGEKKSIWAVLVTEFSPEIWLYIVIALVVASFFVMLFTNVADTYLPGSRMFDSVSGAAFYLYRTLLGAPTPFLPESSAARFLISTWFIFSIILGAAYSAAFSSLVTVPWFPKDIDTLEGLVEAKLTIISHWTFVRHLPDDNPNSAEAILRKSAIVHHETWFVSLRRMLKDGDKAALYTKLFVENVIAHMNATESPQFHVFKDMCVTKSMVSPMVTRKGSPLTRPLDRAVERILESGLVDYWLRSIPLVPHPDGLNIKPFSLRNVVSAFVVHAIGLFISTLVFIAERLLAKLNKQRLKNKRKEK